MLRRLLRAMMLSAFLGLLAASAPAQYMFLDTNGDAVFNEQDVLSPATTTINVYLDTNHRRDGSSAVCAMEPSSSITINSYEIIFRVTSGSLTYGAWADAMGFNIMLGNAVGATDRYVGWGSVNILPPGRYRLGALSVSGVTSNASIGIASSTPLVPYAYTSFGSQCVGNDFDNTMKLGSDWFDTDGLTFGCTPTDPNNSPPAIDAPATASGAEGSAIEIQASASDPDAANTLLVTVSGAPSSLVLSGNSGPSPLAPVLAGILGYSDGGTHKIRWHVGDGACAFATDSTSLMVAGVDRAPVINAPATWSGNEGTPIQFNVFANDPDGDPIASLTAGGLPAGAFFNVFGGQTSGTFSWTPGFGESGTYPLSFTATNILSTTHHTTLTVLNADRSPAVVAPASRTTAEGAALSFGVTASDPDGEPIASLVATNLPAGASFNVAPDHLSGTFDWTPNFSQAGNYSVVFTATNSLTGSATTFITVTNVDRPPVLTLPGDQVVNEGAPLEFDVSAVDPDGSELYYFYASPLPAGAYFYPPYPYAVGQFVWTPSFTQSGEYVITFTAYNTLSTSGTVRITVLEVNQVPVITAPNSVFSAEGNAIAFDVAAPDADGEAVTIEIQNRPAGATFYDLGNAHGSFQWTPSYGQAGVYTVTFIAQDTRGGLAAPKSTTIHVDDLNRPPVASAGGPYTGIIGVEAAFDGTGSSDPDGNPLQFSWDYGDGATGSGPTPSHTYMAGGRFTVTLAVSDGMSSAADATSITIQDVFPARAFTTNANATIRLGSGKATWCAQIEPEGNAYLNTAVIASTVSMTYGGTTIFA
ncbi:MAG TPA: putative Ig domain-containing protein, partial [Candidatus Eisenbacteria bacterium]|nr:putative Ig domain-containing protein [Candidatus Eisenbacteria bacterium]